MPSVFIRSLLLLVMVIWGASRLSAAQFDIVATPNPVTSTTTNVALSGDDPTEPGVTYIWEVSKVPAGGSAVVATPAAAATQVTFSTVGSYRIECERRVGKQKRKAKLTIDVVSTLHTLTVVPAETTVAAGASTPFTVNGTNQFGTAISPLPTVTWSVSGGGTVNAAGVFTAGSQGGTWTVTASAGGVSGQATVRVAAADAAPTIATAAAATLSADGISAALHVLGADDAGEAALAYTWSAIGPGEVTFSANGTNAAKAATATFAAHGTYVFTATATDAGALSATSSVSVTVDAVPRTLNITPASVNLPRSGTQVFGVSVADQFGGAILSPAVIWTASGDATITSAGHCVVGDSLGTVTITATSGTATGVATVTVVNAAPTIATTATATLSADGISASLHVLGADDAGEDALAYTWSATGPAEVTFSENSTNAAKNCTAMFTALGTYTLIAAATDADIDALSVISSVTLTVPSVSTAVRVSPASISLPRGGTQAFNVSAADQFAGTIVSPTVSWSVSGDGAIDEGGLFTAGTVLGPVVITATSGATTGTATVTVVNSAPTIAAAATATLSPDGTGAALSVLGADDVSEVALVYTWSATGPAAVTFSVNGSNAAKSSTATFFAPGTYVLTAIATDAGGLTVTSSVTIDVGVQRTVRSITLTPANSILALGASRRLLAVAKDQFGVPITSEYAVTWGISDGGLITNDGEVIATALGTYTVTATIAGVTGDTRVTVFPTSAPQIVWPLSVEPSPVTGTYADLSLFANDDGGPNNLTYTWQVYGPDSAVFSVNGTNLAKNTTLSFTQPGYYFAFVTVSDVDGNTTTDGIGIEVLAQAASVIITPSQTTIGVAGSVALSAETFDQFGVPMNSGQTVDWTVVGPGSIDSSGQFLAGGRAGRAEITAIVNGTLVTGKAIVDVINASPTVASGPSATPSPVTGTSAVLTILGADDAGEQALTYTWSLVSPVAEVVSFGAENGSHNGATITATFSATGTYVVRCDIRDVDGATVSAEMTVPVSAELSTLAVVPGSLSAPVGRSVPLELKGADQFGALMAIPPGTVWSLSGPGTITSDGVVQITGVGAVVVTARNGDFSAPARLESATADSDVVVSMTAVSGLTGDRTGIIDGDVAWFSSASAVTVDVSIMGDGSTPGDFVAFLDENEVARRSGSGLLVIPLGDEGRRQLVVGMEEDGVVRGQTGVVLFVDRSGPTVKWIVPTGYRLDPAVDEVLGEGPVILNGRSIADNRVLRHDAAMSLNVLSVSDDQAIQGRITDLSGVRGSSRVTWSDTYARLTPTLTGVISGSTDGPVVMVGGFSSMPDLNIAGNTAALRPAGSIMVTLTDRCGNDGTATLDVGIDRGITWAINPLYAGSPMRTLPRITLEELAEIWISVNPQAPPVHGHPWEWQGQQRGFLLDRAILVSPESYTSVSAILRARDWAGNEDTQGIEIFDGSGIRHPLYRGGDYNQEQYAYTSNLSDDVRQALLESHLAPYWSYLRQREQDLYHSRASFISDGQPGETKNFSLSTGLFTNLRNFPEFGTTPLTFLESGYVFFGQQGSNVLVDESDSISDSTFRLQASLYDPYVPPVPPSPYAGAWVWNSDPVVLTLRAPGGIQSVSATVDLQATFAGTPGVELRRTPEIVSVTGAIRVEAQDPYVAMPVDGWSTTYVAPLRAGPASARRAQPVVLNQPPSWSTAPNVIRCRVTDPVLASGWLPWHQQYFAFGSTWMTSRHPEYVDGYLEFDAFLTRTTSTDTVLQSYGFSPVWTPDDMPFTFPWRGFRQLPAPEAYTNIPRNWQTVVRIANDIAVAGSAHELHLQGIVFDKNFPVTDFSPYADVIRFLTPDGNDITIPPEHAREVTVEQARSKIIVTACHRAGPNMIACDLRIGADVPATLLDVDITIGMVRAYPDGLSQQFAGANGAHRMKGGLAITSARLIETRFANVDDNTVEPAEALQTRTRFHHLGRVTPIVFLDEANVVDDVLQIRGRVISPAQILADEAGSPAAQVELRLGQQRVFLTGDGHFTAEVPVSTAEKTLAITAYDTIGWFASSTVAITGDSIEMKPSYTWNPTVQTFDGGDATSPVGIWLLAHSPISIEARDAKGRVIDTVSLPLRNENGYVRSGRFVVSPAGPQADPALRGSDNRVLVVENLDSDLVVRVDGRDFATIELAGIQFNDIDDRRFEVGRFAAADPEADAPSFDATSTAVNYDISARNVAGDFVVTVTDRMTGSVINKNFLWDYQDDIRHVQAKSGLSIPMRMGVNILRFENVEDRDGRAISQPHADEVYLRNRNVPVQGDHAEVGPENVIFYIEVDRSKIEQNNDVAAKTGRVRGLNKMLKRLNLRVVGMEEFRDQDDSTFPILVNLWLKPDGNHDPDWIIDRLKTEGFIARYYGHGQFLVPALQNPPVDDRRPSWQQRGGNRVEDVRWSQALARAERDMWDNQAVLIQREVIDVPEVKSVYVVDARVVDADPFGGGPSLLDGFALRKPFERVLTRQPDYGQVDLDGPSFALRHFSLTSVRQGRTASSPNKPGYPLWIDAQETSAPTLADLIGPATQGVVISIHGYNVDSSLKSGVRSADGTLRTYYPGFQSLLYDASLANIPAYDPVTKSGYLVLNVAWVGNWDRNWVAPAAAFFNWDNALAFDAGNRVLWQLLRSIDVRRRAIGSDKILPITICAESLGNRVAVSLLNGAKSVFNTSTAPDPDLFQFPMVRYAMLHPALRHVDLANAHQDGVLRLDQLPHSPIQSEMVGLATNGQTALLVYSPFDKPGLVFNSVQNADGPFFQPPEVQMLGRVGLSADSGYERTAARVGIDAFFSGRGTAYEDLWHVTLCGWVLPGMQSPSRPTYEWNSTTWLGTRALFSAVPRGDNIQITTREHLAPLWQALGSYIRTGSTPEQTP